jgi:hypothetical protein
MGMKERSRQRRKRIVAHIAHSHEEAEQWDLEYWQNQTPQERLSALRIMQKELEKIRGLGT